MRTFVACRVKPNICTTAIRARHRPFGNTTIEHGVNAELARAPSGLCQPAYMLDILHKINGPNYLEAEAPGRSRHGFQRSSYYPPPK